MLSLLLVAFGMVAFDRLPLREYPDIDPPVISIETVYPGASASVVETRITELIEERIAGVEGIRFIASNSVDGKSTVNIRFSINRDMNAAANDIRDRVFGILDILPNDARPPEIEKADADDDVIMWLNLESDRLSVPELTDYAERYMVDRFSVIDGVARVRVGGGQRYAMRIWLDRKALAAYDLTSMDVETALRAANLELPAGSIESIDRQFTVRVERIFNTPESFAALVVRRGEDGHLLRLGDVARVELGTVEERIFFRGNGKPMVGIGIVKQSAANTIDVARAAKDAVTRINPTLPDGMVIRQSYDTSIFIEQAIREVYRTLFIATLLVIAVIYCFLGSIRATLIPAVTVPVSLVATFIVLYALDFSINLLTLLALVLAIGLVVDDAIVMLENIYRRMREKQETPLVAAYKGTRQVGFAIIATTLVLIAIFVPITFLTGDMGRLFSEFAITIAAAVGVSSLVALTLSPMLASTILKYSEKAGRDGYTQRMVSILQEWYLRLLDSIFRHPLMMLVIFAGVIAMAITLWQRLPTEYAPKEDRGAFFILVNGPEGATYSYMKNYMDTIESRMMPMVEKGEISRLLIRAPRSFGNYASFNSGILICVLNDWNQRRSAWDIMNDVRKLTADLPGVVAFPIMRQGFGGRTRKPVQFVLGGGSYEELAEWRNILMETLKDDNPGLVGMDWDYKETKPQIGVRIDYRRAAELGVSVGNIGQTLQTMLGSRRLTTYIHKGEEYDVVLEGERGTQRTPTDLQNIYVESERSSALIPLANLVTLEEFADANTLNRYNRVRSITLEANLAEGYTLGEALQHLESLVDAHLPEEVIVDYKGQSQDLKYSKGSIAFIFALGIVVVFLVLAAQFESWVHPFIIMLTVPLAVAGGLLGLWLTGGSLNIYSQIGLLMLIGLAAKNGILIVEFANQLRDEGMAFDDALRTAARIRLRPILMTGITTAAGAVPLIISFGAGAETRMVIGVVVLSGVLAATLFTLCVIPAAYSLLARNTGSPGDTAHRLEQEMKQTPPTS